MILGTPVIAITLVLVAAERALAPRHLRSEARRRPGALPAPVLVLLAPGRLHHDPAGHGRDQRARRRRSRASRSSATRSSRSRASRSRSSASSCGATTCSSAASRSTPASCSRSSRCSSPCPSAVEDVQLDGDDVQGRDHRGDRRRSGSSASWACSLIGGLTGLFLATLGLDIHLHRHVLRRRALPLHHGRRRDHGVTSAACTSGGRR